MPIILYRPIKEFSSLTPSVTYRTFKTVLRLFYATLSSCVLISVYAADSLNFKDFTNPRISPS